MANLNINGTMGSTQVISLYILYMMIIRISPVTWDFTNMYI